MNLHHKEEFNDLVALTAEYIGIPSSAVVKDYFIVMMLKQLQGSEYANDCVFKGGTSLSKCYPGTINRFSENIDITFFTTEDLSDKQYNKILKKIEESMSYGAEQIEKCTKNRGNRSKSSFVWFQKDV